MEDTKVLNPEVSGLLETVRKQAWEYSEAFVFLQKAIEEHKLQKSDLKKQISDFSDNFTNVKNLIDKEKKDFDDYTGKIILKLETEILKIEHKYQELSDSSNLKIEARKLVDNLTEELSKLHATSEDFRSLVVFEIDSALNKFKKSFDDRINELKEIFSKSLEKKTEQIELKFMNFERNQKYLKDDLNKELQALKDTLEAVNRFSKATLKTLTDDVDGLKYDAKNLERDVRDFITYGPQELGKGKSHNEKETGQHINTEDFILIDKYDSDYKKMQSFLDSKLNYLTNELDDYTQQIDKNSSKINIALFISVGSIIGFLILLFLFM